MLDLFGTGFTLLVFPDAHAHSAEMLQSAFRERGMPLRVVEIHNDEAAKLYERPLVLVRPDGHVAWRGTQVENAGHIADVVRGAAVLEPALA